MEGNDITGRKLILRYLDGDPFNINDLTDEE